jgi:hypothetical protein
MRYRLTLVPAQFHPGWIYGHREFDAPDDATAIHHAEYPAVPMQFVMPNGDGTCDSYPRKLVEIVIPDDPRPTSERIVKEW